MTAPRTKSLAAIAVVALLTMGSLGACGSDTDKIATATTTTDATSGSTVADTETAVDTSSTMPAGTTNATATTVPDDGNPATGEAVDNPGKSWTADASAYRQKPGTQVRFDCPPKGEDAQIWGSGPYTDDSSVCVAAVHAGVISLADGGKVVIKVGGAKESFTGSTAHGITSDDYGPWDGSFIFMKS